MVLRMPCRQAEAARFLSGPHPLCSAGARWALSVDPLQGEDQSKLKRNVVRQGSTSRTTLSSCAPVRYL